MVSFDHPDDGSMPFLHAYFENGGLIVAPLYGLTEIPGDEVTFCAAPLRLVGASAAPCRVLAWPCPKLSGNDTPISWEVNC